MIEYLRIMHEEMQEPLSKEEKEQVNKIYGEVTVNTFNLNELKDADIPF